MTAETPDAPRTAAGTTGAPGAARESFYASALDQPEQERLQQALEMEGVDDEIAYLRVELKRRAGKEQLRSIAMAVNSIVRAVRARHAMTPQDAETLRQTLFEQIEQAARSIDTAPTAG